MAVALRTGAYALTPIARTGDRFADFGPYVASINDAGIVAFTAVLRDGGSGVSIGEGGATKTVAESAGGCFDEVCSHPDINGDGIVCFYAKRAGACGVFVARGREIAGLAGAAGPLGPTMNEAGTVAFRAGEGGGCAGIYTARGAAVTTIAKTGDVYSAFHGLPVVNRAGHVLFRADLARGGAGIFIDEEGRVGTVVETGERFSALGLFPMMNDAGTVVLSGALVSGGTGVFTARDGVFETVIDSRGAFESFRGALIDGAGRVVFFATPRAGRLGVFCGPDPATDRVLSVGSDLLGSTVAEFALNPVSINRAGQLAIRVGLTDGGQFIVRADPGGQ